MSDKEVRPPFGPEMQRKVLRYMMSDTRFCARCCHYLKADYFAGNLSWFFRKIKEYFEVYHELITPEILATEVYKQDDPVKFDLERNEITKLNLEEGEKRYLRNEMNGFIQQNIFVSTAQESVQLYNAGQREAAYKKMHEKLQEMFKISFDSDRLTRFGNWKEEVDKAATQTLNAIPTGILPIDKALHGGLLPGTWTTFLGPSNVGKSLLCVNLAYHAALKGKKTFITIHEDEQGPTYLRYLARFSGVPFVKLNQPREFLSDDELWSLEAADRMLSEHVLMNFMYGRDSTIEAVQETMRLVKLQFDFDLFLCDYGQCLKTSAFKNMDNTYSVQEHIYSELKQICLELNIAGAGGAQVNRQGNKINKTGTDFLRMTDVGDSWGIAKKSSNVITMNRSEDDIANNRIIFLLDKARNGKVPCAAQCITDYARCLTHDSGMPQSEVGTDLQKVNEDRADAQFQQQRAKHNEEVNNPCTILQEKNHSISKEDRFNNSKQQQMENAIPPHP